jgi:protein-L-isoaspartate(D-aspartate) O-methyltransferase
VLDVGTGSGYAAAVLAELAESVVTVERIPELSETAAVALRQAGYPNVDVRVGDGALGAADRAPFGAIAVAAAAPDVPPALWEQLAVGARIVLPLELDGGQRLVALERTPGGPRLHGSTTVRFVPLVSGA